jgi:hypothetical protein
MSWPSESERGKYFRARPQNLTGLVDQCAAAARRRERENLVLRAQSYRFERLDDIN